MPERPTSHAQREAGFVVLPIDIVTHPDVTDADIRILLVLDHIRWQEGCRDGLIDVRDEEIGRRLHKSAWSVSRSLKRLASLGDWVLSFEAGSATSARRERIQLGYERFARKSVIMPVVTNLSIAKTEDSAEQICSQPVSSCPIVPEPVTVGKDEDSQEQICFNDCNGAEQVCSPLPISERGLLLHHRGGSDCNGQEQICSAPSEPADPAGSLPPSPKTLPELLASLSWITDDKRDLERLRKKSPLWVARLQERCPQHAAVAVEWVWDALIAGTDKDDVVTYAEKLLAVYAGQGGRPDIELAPRPKAVPDETDTRAPAAVPSRPPAYAARPTKAQRNAEIAAARRASMARLFPAKEVNDGPR